MRAVKPDDPRDARARRDLTRLMHETSTCKNGEPDRGRVIPGRSADS